MTRTDGSRRLDDRLRTMAFVLGLCVAAGFVLSMRFPPNGGSLGADIHVVVAPTGELAAKPTGMVLEGVGMEPGADPVAGDLEVLNQTGVVLDVRLRGIPDGAGLDRSLWISLTGPDGEELYRGPLGGFRDWTASAIAFHPGEWRSFHIEAWLPADTEPGFAGRMAQVDLGFKVRVEAGS
jgi:hypothetical protein